MARVWVLDTETKGTGANMVPLDKVQRKPAPKPARTTAPPRRAAPKEEVPEPRQAPRFKVVDALSREVLAEGAGTRATVDLLDGVRSIVDVTVYVRDERDASWRRLSHREKKLLWQLRRR